jgi:hypothetical protein
MHHAGVKHGAFLGWDNLTAVRLLERGDKMPADIEKVIDDK